MIRKISFFLLLLPNLLWANINVTIDSTPGGIAQITFESEQINPEAFYGSAALYVQALGKNQYQVLIGLPLMTKPGSKRITLQGADIRYAFIEVDDQNYADEYFETTVNVSDNQDSSSVRINNERVLFTKARKTFSTQPLSEGYFVSPTHGRVTSVFGVNRYVNDEKGLPHIGLDIANTTGTHVNASASGRVILVRDFYYLGKTVFIDHGQGLLSSYSHLSEVSVIEGQTLRKGQELGKIGTTGRSTGPHLHWSVFMNQVAINPELLLDISL
ncbi:MAG: peptidoglycan DD-metalloendopeptidase family protein [Gammaproteobacteria bacterium]